MRFRAAILIALPALLLSAGGRRHRGPLINAKDAKAIAARETGGEAVSAKEIPLNGSSGGWEVDVHMAHEHQGWRCVVDDDSRMVYSKTRIENPPLPEHRGRKKN